MTRGLTPPSVQGELSSLKKRVTDLERKLDSLGSAGLNLGLPFTLAGEVVVSGSPPWVTPVSLRIAAIVALLGTTGTTTTTVVVKVNGTTAATLSLGSGEGARKLTTSIRLTPDQDVVTVECTAAGTGAEDLDVILRFR